MPQLIDTHAHIYVNRFDSDRADMIQRARDVGVRSIVMPAIDVKSVYQAIDLCRQHENLYAMAALHPSETREAGDSDFEEIKSLCDDPHVVAVGESGLDYYWDRTFDSKQQELFRLHIQLAMRTDLPLIIHMRDKQGRDEVHVDLVEIIKEEKRSSPQSDRLRGIFHCFGGPEWLAHEAFALNFVLGIGGTVTFKNSGVADLVERIPLDRLVLETDAPYLAPVPFRGKRNEPSYIVHVAEKVAEIKGISPEEVGEITSQTARQLFDIP